MENNYYPKRLLCIVGSMNVGGAETFLMKVYRSIDKTKYQMDFLALSMEEGYYEEEIQRLGGKVYHSVPKTKSFFKSLSMIASIVKKGNYTHVMRISEHSLSTLDLIAAKVGGAKHTIFRSSNSRVVGGKFSEILHLLLKVLPITIPNVKIAPSTEAAEFMFGKDSIKRDKVNIIKNAIVIDNFRFKKERRKNIRNEFQINNKFVVGHVGRLNPQKNHNFLIDIFAEINLKNSDAVLLLVGEGELEKKIKTKIKDLGIENKVIFTGIRPDIADIMMAMDVFIFPSFYEGMPNTVIEAQGTGLPCIISNTITREADITGIVHYLSLDNPPKVWAEKALCYSKGYERKDTEVNFIERGYSMEYESMKFLKTIYSID